METVLEIENAIERLSPQAFRELRNWIAERDWQEWDAQIERDVTAGRLDALRKRVLADDDAGQCADL